MAEDDGSFDHAKNHGKSNNHEVIEHIKSYAPADATAVKKPDPTMDKLTKMANTDQQHYDRAAGGYYQDNNSHNRNLDGRDWSGVNHALIDISSSPDSTKDIVHKERDLLQKPADKANASARARDAYKNSKDKS